MLYVWIMIGSALGGAARYWLSGVVSNSFGETFPWGTILVNVSGCFVIGLFGTLTGPDGRLVVGTTTRQFVMVGLCGGYTTFSSFSVQTLYLARDGDWFRASANVFLSLALCFLAVWLGHIAASAAGDVAGAMVVGEKSPAMRHEPANDAIGAGALSDLLVGSDRISAVPGAIAGHEGKLAFHRDLARDKSNAQAQSDLSVSLSEIGAAKLLAGDAAAALAAYEEGLAIRRDLAQGESDAEAQRALAASLRNVADALKQLGKLAEALAYDDEAVAVLETLVRLGDGGDAAQNDLANALRRVGTDQRILGQLDEAFVDYDRALAFWGRLADAHPERLNLRDDMDEAAGSMGGLAFELLLARNYEKSLKASDRAVAAAPGLTRLYINRAHALMFLGRADEARKLYLAHRGEKTQGDKTWEGAIRNDFAVFREAGLADPLINEIERTFAKKNRAARPSNRRAR